MDCTHFVIFIEARPTDVFTGRELSSKEAAGKRTIVSLAFHYDDDGSAYLYALKTSLFFRNNGMRRSSTPRHKALY